MKTNGQSWWTMQIHSHHQLNKKKFVSFQFLFLFKFGVLGGINDGFKLDKRKNWWLRCMCVRIFVCVREFFICLRWKAKLVVQFQCVGLRETLTLMAYALEWNTFCEEPCTFGVSHSLFAMTNNLLKLFSMLLSMMFLVGTIIMIVWRMISLESCWKFWKACIGVMTSPVPFKSCNHVLSFFCVRSLCLVVELLLWFLCFFLFFWWSTLNGRVCA